MPHAHRKSIPRQTRLLVRAGARGLLRGTTLLFAPFLAADASALELPCGWTPDLFNVPGTSHAILSTAVYDEGDGPRLFVSGPFTRAGAVSANRVARWDGAGWSDVGGGLTNASYAMTVHDDGTGAALYMGGGSALGSEVVRWDGAAWSTVGVLLGSVRSLFSFDDGSGPRLYAGVSFTGPNTAAVYSWDGTTWTQLGGTFASASAGVEIRDIAASGGVLHAGGFFHTVGGSSLPYLVKWNGSAWADVGGGPNGKVYALEDVAGALYAGGTFSTLVGGVPAKNVARRDSTGWSAIGQGLDNTVTDLRRLTVGGSTDIYACGLFTKSGTADVQRVARLSGSSWVPLGATPANGLSGAETGSGWELALSGLVAWDDGSGSALYPFGQFLIAGSVPVRNIARWNGSSWSRLGSGAHARIKALAVHDAGSGPRLYAGCGNFAPGNSAVSMVYVLEPTGWQPVAGAFSGVTAGASFAIEELASHGGALYATGRFDGIDGVTCSNIARWNGLGWQALGTGLNSTGLCLLSQPDGLYAGGAFSLAGGVTGTAFLARWDGLIWSGVGGGVGAGGASGTGVGALKVWDDGTGSALYVAGQFTRCNGVSGFNHIARWTGSAWQALGTGISPQTGASFPAITDLETFDDGTGPRLYATGSFASAGGAGSTNDLARWDGTTWTAVPGWAGQTPTGYDLAVFDDGCGPGLYVASASYAGWPSSGRIGRYDAGGWESVGGGADDGDAHAHALQVHDDEYGPALFLGGSTRTVGGGVPSWSGGRWTHCECLPTDVHAGTPVASRLRWIAEGPNPFRDEARLALHVPGAGRVVVSVHSVTGARVRQLLDAPQQAGELRVDWDGTADSGRPVATGIYFLRAVQHGEAVTRKVVMRAR